MSQHPFNWPHGRAPPTQPRAHQTASHHQSAPYGAPYNRGSAEQNFAASQSAFESNTNRIPGLGGGPTAGANPYRAPPGIGGAWQQAPFSPAPGTSLTRQAPQPTKSAAVPPLKSASITTLQVPHQDFEEGELSEGQFEDLYEPKLAQPSKTATKHVEAQPAKPPPPIAQVDDREDSVMDSPGADLYDNEEEGEIVGDQKNDRARERTGSYSPYLSPREVQSRVNTPRQVAVDAGQNSNKPKTNTDFTVKTVPGLGNLSIDHVGSTVSRNQVKPLNTAKTPPLPAKKEQQRRAFRSVQEAKKEAQKAILRLLHLGVKYQDYIDEGIDETTVKRYFSELKLDASQAKAAPLSPAQKAPQPASIVSRAANASKKATAENSSTEPTKTSVVADKSEERKDRIARLLKLKNMAKPAAPATVPATPQSTANAAQSTSSPASSGKPEKVWGEKERLIQQKLRDLQKKREAEGQQAGSRDDPSTSPQQSQAPHENSSAPAPGKVEAQATSKENTQVPEAQVASKQNTQVPPSTSQSPSVVGTPSHLARQQTQTTQRKRPVAADFVDYSSSTASVKRPFGQVRRNSSYIIDVTDESDSGEMDMDMDSLPDTSTIQLPGMLIRDFPPLSDATNGRRFSTAAPSSQTAQNLAKQSALELKEKAIQDMKRKIAEAEAKTQAKRSARSTPPISQAQTPQPTQQPVQQPARQPSDPAAQSPVLPRRATSSVTDGPSAQLFAEAKASLEEPKPVEPGSLQPQKAGRRTRIVSAELPRIDSDLDLKRTRLRQLQEEQARLQAEVEQCLEAKRQLDAELKDIDTTPEDLCNGHDTDDLRPSGDSVKKQDAAAPAPVESVTGSGENLPVGDAEDVPMDEGDSPEQAAGVEDVSKPDANEPDTNDSPRDDSSAQSGEHGQQQTEPADADPENTVVQSPVMDDTKSSEQETQQDTPMDDAESVESDAPMDDADSEDDAISDACEPREAGTDGSADIDTIPDVNSNGHAAPESASDTSAPEQAKTTMAIGAAAAASEDSTNGTTATFRPYESPLRYFSAYRFHPKYRETVQGGLKSLTYSNKIRTNDVLCPRELAGEECLDDCEFQHFSSMIAPDSVIISELGKYDKFTGEQRDAFIAGLREVLAKFRAENVKDFDTIAHGIINFRARFLGDELKVLPLGDVNI